MRLASFSLIFSFRGKSPAQGGRSPPCFFCTLEGTYAEPRKSHSHVISNSIDSGCRLLLPTNSFCLRSLLIPDMMMLSWAGVLPPSRLPTTRTSLSRIPHMLYSAPRKHLFFFLPHIASDERRPTSGARRLPSITSWRVGSWAPAPPAGEDPNSHRGPRRVRPNTARPSSLPYRTCPCHPDRASRSFPDVPPTIPVC